MLEHVLGDIRGESDERMVVPDINAVDLATVQIAFMRERADDIARLDAMSATDLDPKNSLRTLRTTRPRRFPRDRFALSGRLVLRQRVDSSLGRPFGDE